MAVRTKNTFKALYGTSGSQFPDNTSGDIGADDVRAQGEDIADSLSFNAGINTSIVEVSEWDMNTDATVTTAHNLDLSKIISVSAMVRDDSDGSHYQFPYYSGTNLDGWISDINTTDIVLSRRNLGTFDSIAFQSIGIANRAWLVISYID